MATLSERATSVTVSEGLQTAKRKANHELFARADRDASPGVFSREGISPYDEVEWDSRTAEIKDELAGG